MITIEHRILASETLDNLISHIVLREGTDYGVEDIPFEVKKSNYCSGFKMARPALSMIVLRMNAILCRKNKIARMMGE